MNRVNVSHKSYSPIDMHEKVSVEKQQRLDLLVNRIRSRMQQQSIQYNRVVVIVMIIESKGVVNTVCSIEWQ